VEQDRPEKKQPFMLELPRLYGIVDAEMLASKGLELRAFVQELHDGGISLLQYRDKRGSEGRILENAAVISEIFHTTSAMLVMNDFPDLAARAGWSSAVPPTPPSRSSLPMRRAPTTSRSGRYSRLPPSSIRSRLWDWKAFAGRVR
jgi:hypothetical protein